MASETKRITKRIIDAARKEKRAVEFWDTEVTGLMCRVYATGRASFLLFYRTQDNTSRKPKIGSFGELTVDQAREIAREWLHIVKQGGDPSKTRQSLRRAPTVEDLAERYLREHAVPKKKPSSVETDRANLRLHVLPRLGKLKVTAIGLDDVQSLHHAMRETTGAANRVLSLVSKMLNLAETWGWRSIGSNPCARVQRYKERKLHRDLNDLELRRLANVLQEAEGDDPTVALNPTAIAAIRFLLFTGVRRSECLRLRWDEVDFERNVLRLRDSKTGSKIVPLNVAARTVLEGVPRDPENAYVFASPKNPGRPLHDINKPWMAVRERAGLGDVRLHDLRHNFATHAVGLQHSLPVIGSLLGHKSQATTQRYAELQLHPLQEASEKISQRLANSMGFGADRASQ